MEQIYKEIERLKQRLAQENLKAVIIPHISPDGDAVGACSAFYTALTKAG